MKVLQSNWMIVIFLSIIFVAISEVILYEMNVMMSFATLNFTEFTETTIAAYSRLKFSVYCRIFLPI